MSKNKTSNRGRPVKGGDVTDVGAVRALLSKYKFSPMEALIELVANPPEDMKTSDRIAALKFLAEFEAPKLKSVEAAGSAKRAGVSVTVVDFRGAGREDMGAVPAVRKHKEAVAKAVEVDDV